MGCPPLGPAPPKPSPLRGKVARRTPRRMRGLPFPVPLFREGRGKPRPYGGTWDTPQQMMPVTPSGRRHNLIGPDTPSGRAHKDGGRTMWPLRIGRRHPVGAASSRPKSLPPSRGKVSRRTPRRMRGLPFPAPLFREGRGKPRPYMGRKGSAPPQKTGAWGSVLLQIPPRPGSVLREQLRLLGAQLLQDLLVRLGGQIQPLIEVGAAATGTQDGLLPPPLVHLGVVA